LSEPADARLGSSRPSFSAAHGLRAADKAHSQNPPPRLQPKDKVDRWLPARRSGFVLKWIWISAMLTRLCSLEPFTSENGQTQQRVQLTLTIDRSLSRL
jgi:hypothetical protein